MLVICQWYRVVVVVVVVHSHRKLGVPHVSPLLLHRARNTLGGLTGYFFSLVVVQSLSAHYYYYYNK